LRQKHAVVNVQSGIGVIKNTLFNDYWFNKENIVYLVFKDNNLFLRLVGE